MFQDAYIKLDRLEVEELLEKTKKSFDGISFNAENTVIMSRDLPFYPGYKFYDMADHTHMPPSRRFVLMKDEKVTVLDFTNTPIYTLNNELPVQLTRETVKDYVRFFFTFVRGRHGRFIIVETVDDIAWREEPPPAARKSIAKLIKEISFHSSDKEDGSFFMQAQMMFRDSLFQADVSVKPDGLVQLSNESLLIEDMPILDDTFGQ